MKNIGKVLGVLSGSWSFFLVSAPAHAGAYAFPVAADATVRKAYAAKNYGSESRLDVDGSGRGTTEEVYLRFAVSGLNGAVTSAKVRVYVTNGSSDGPGIYATDVSWSESSITWSNRPSRGEKLEGKGRVGKGWLEYDVTSAVKTDGVYGFALAEDAEDGVDLYAREGSSSYRAQLVVTTGSATAPAPSPKPTVSPTPNPAPSPGPIASSPPVPGDPLAGAVFTSLGSADVSIDGVAYGNQSAEKSHSIQRSQNGKIFRFEVREGEGRAGKDSGRDRAELSQDVDYPKGTDLWASYSFMLEKGAAITGNPDNVFTQWHGGAGSPPLSIRVPADNTLFVRSISGTSRNGVNTIPYTTSGFERGKWYHVVQHVVFNSEGRGIIEIWMNGKKVVDVRDRSTTYSDSTHNYWKFGVYRDTIAPTEVVYYANMEAGTKNLFDRIAQPLPIAP